MEHQNNNQKIDLKDLNIKKVKETRYKILIFVILLISYLAYPYLAGIYSEVQSLKESIVEKQKILKQKDRQIVDLKNVESKIKFFEKNKGKIANCINNGKCENLNLSKNDKMIAKAYFMFSKYRKLEKMDYDQKQVLSDILTYFQDRGKINVISFGNILKLQNFSNVYVLPITINADFSNYYKFIDFLRTVEKKIYPKKVKNLYLIKNLSYNILNYNKSQTVTINMDLYFYK